MSIAVRSMNKLGDFYQNACLHEVCSYDFLTLAQYIHYWTSTFLASEVEHIFVPTVNFSLGSTLNAVLQKESTLVATLPRHHNAPPVWKQRDRKKKDES